MITNQRTRLLFFRPSSDLCIDFNHSSDRQQKKTFIFSHFDADISSWSIKYRDSDSNELSLVIQRCATTCTVMFCINIHMQ